MRVLRSAMVGTVLLMAAAGMMGAGQMSSQSSGSGRLNPGLPIDGHIDGRKGGDVDPGVPEMLERQERSRNSDRQRRLVADTEKLLELATDLKSQVKKTDKSAPPVDAAKKAEEIEKLAKSVRDRMKG